MQLFSCIIFLRVDAATLFYFTIMKQKTKYTTSNLDNNKYKDYSVLKQETLGEVAEEYYVNNIFCDGITEFEHDIAIRCYIAGVKSDVAKDYWFEQFKKK